MKQINGWRKKISRQMMCVLIGVLAFNSNSSAQWIVEDPLAISKMVQEYIETAQRWKQTADHYQQQLIKFKKLTFVASQFADDFSLRDATYGMEDCPGSDKFPISVDDLLKTVKPDLKGDVIKEQRKICQRIVLAKNNKYNDTVMMMRTLIQRQRELQSIELQRTAVGTNQGALAANDNEIQRLLTRATMDLDFWQSRSSAYDGYISALQEDSDRLAKCAMRGCSNGLEDLVGNIVQAAALKAALSVD